jgi:hypothetical protein
MNCMNHQSALDPIKTIWIGLIESCLFGGLIVSSLSLFTSSLDSK